MRIGAAGGSAQFPTLPASRRRMRFASGAKLRSGGVIGAFMSNPAFTPVPDEQMEWIMKMESIFFPVARRQREKHYNAQPSSLRADPAKFVHYTSADAALKHHQLVSVCGCVTPWPWWTTEKSSTALIFGRRISQSQRTWQAFAAALDASRIQGSAQQAVTLLRPAMAHDPLRTRTSHPSQSMTPAEDNHGRLSMWRGVRRHRPPRCYRF